MQFSPAKLATSSRSGPGNTDVQQSSFVGSILYASTLKDAGDVASPQDEPEGEVDSHEVNGIAPPAAEEEDDTSEAVVLGLTEEEEEARHDAAMMQLAIQQANSRGGERGARSPFPKPIVGAVIVTKDGRVIGRGRASYKKDAVRAAIADAGIVATPLREWCVSWPSDQRLRKDVAESTLYVTLEPSTERQGYVSTSSFALLVFGFIFFNPVVAQNNSDLTPFLFAAQFNYTITRIQLTRAQKRTSVPPITQLIEESGIPRVVIGCSDPIPEQSGQGASALHAAGLSVTMGVEQDDCEGLISEYTSLALTKLHRMARSHFRSTGRPLGFMHCSVIDSDDAESFARNGNTFGKTFGGQILSFRDFGSYALAPPPESIWEREVDDEDDDEFSTEIDDLFQLEFEEEDWQENLNKNPMMPWYEQVDACVATFPKKGNGPATDDDSVTSRLFGLKWLADQGRALPAAVERILVMDATDLEDLPMTNDDPVLPKGVDIEGFWSGNGRKPSRVLLRHGDNAQAIAAADSAAEAAALAAEAAQRAKSAIESGDAEAAAEAAIMYQKAAVAATEVVQKEMRKTQDLKQKLTDMGVIVEVIKGGEPIDVMNHLGKRNGYKAVVWRAGCWGERGVQAILAGAFQWVSAHLAVDAVGGKFWQLILAERAVQAACGPERKVKVIADQEDISLEYCDDEGADADCNLTVNNKPVRHVRLDCRVLLEDDNGKRELRSVKTKKLDKKFIEEEAPWFL